VSADPIAEYAMSTKADVRPAAVAGTWYAGEAGQLAADIDGYLQATSNDPVMSGLVALIAPHAGLMYSGPVAAHAYHQLASHTVETIVIVGPSHFVAFDGVALYARGGFESPLGLAPIDELFAHDLLAASPVVHEDRGPHRREHSLEMQLPFIRRVAPQAAIVPLLMGHQTAATARALGEALARTAHGKAVVLIASTDLSHYEDTTTAQRLDAMVLDHVRGFDPEGLQSTLNSNPHHACGGGPAVAVMRAARALGATRGIVLHYGDSGDVSGDKSSVVGYLAAALGRA
jgi:AmmeMemoRadiSam system protein B